MLADVPDKATLIQENSIDCELHKQHVDTVAGTK
jgi:hypothetical protein